MSAGNRTTSDPGVTTELSLYLDGALLDPFGENEDDEEGDAMANVMMRHTCAGCGEDNEVLPPLGFRLKRTGKATEAEREIDLAFSDLEESFQLQEAWRRAYAAARKRPRCPAPLIGA